MSGVRSWATRSNTGRGCDSRVLRGYGTSPRYPVLIRPEWIDVCVLGPVAVVLRSLEFLRMLPALHYPA
jgi:hypothetical protein